LNSAITFSFFRRLKRLHLLLFPHGNLNQQNMHRLINPVKYWVSKILVYPNSQWNFFRIEKHIPDLGADVSRLAVGVVQASGVGDGPGRSGRATADHSRAA
jgi:hypothetical protein